MKPRRISFRQVSRTAPGQKRTIVITPGDAGPLTLRLKPPESEYFMAELREVETGTRYELEVTLNTPLPARSVRTNLKLETGIAQAPNITILASAIPRPHVLASPKRFSVPAKRNSDWRQAVHLEWDDDYPHKILGATASDPGLKVHVIDNKGRQEVVLEVAEDYVPRRRAAVVTVTTDDTESPKVRVPVSIFRKAPSPAARRPRAASLETAKPKSNNPKDRAAKARRKSRPSTKQPAPTSD